MSNNDFLLLIHGMNYFKLYLYVAQPMLSENYFMLFKVTRLVGLTNTIELKFAYMHKSN